MPVTSRTTLGAACLIGLLLTTAIARAQDSAEPPAPVRVVVFSADKPGEHAPLASSREPAARAEQIRQKQLEMREAIERKLRQLAEQREEFERSHRERRGQEERSRQRDVESLVERAHELEREGHPEQARHHREMAERIARDMEEFRRHHPPQGEVQVRHLRMAADNLAAAGFNREAEELRNRAEHLEQELRGRPGHDAPAHAILEQLTQMRHQLQELTREVQTLREEVQQLRRMPGPRFHSSAEATEYQPMLAPTPVPVEGGQPVRVVEPTFHLIVPGQSSPTGTTKPKAAFGAIIIGQPQVEVQVSPAPQPLLKSKTSITPRPTQAPTDATSEPQRIETEN